MTELFAGNVEVQYGQASIELDGTFDGAMGNCFLGQSNGLCGAQMPAILFLITGLHTGTVGITINLCDADPGIDENWEEIVEVSFQAPKGEITLMEWAADRGVGMAVPAGSYRARYQGRAMQAANELDTNINDTPVDNYCLDLWPAPPAPDHIMKQTSTVAAYWHDGASKLGGGRITFCSLPMSHKFVPNPSRQFLVGVCRRPAGEFCDVGLCRKWLMNPWF